MSARPMTRRSLLAASAGAVAGTLLRPGATLASLGAAARPKVWARDLGALARGGTTVRLGRSADLLGVEWRAPADADVWLRFRDSPGRWSRWASAGAHGHAPDAARSSGTTVGDPVWSGGTTVVQIRASAPLSGVRLQLVDVSSGLGAAALARRSPFASAAALTTLAPLLAAGPGQPSIVARRAWAQGMAPPRVSPGYGSVRLAFVHHTENPNGYSAGEVPAMLRAIYAYHRFARGWNDIGYNFVVDLYGRIFEARAGGVDEPVVGAQAGGYNLLSTGVAVLGSFAGTPVSAPARDALERLLAWKLALHGRPSLGRVSVRVNPAGAIYSRFPANARVSLPRIAGHRDGDSTNCPGDALYGELPAIRRRVRVLAGHPVRATLAMLPPSPSPPSPSPAPPSQSPPPGSQPASGVPAQPLPGGEWRTLAGTLSHLDGTPVAGVRVAVQVRSVSARGEVVSERTIAEASTDAQGRWSLAVSLEKRRGAGTSLRALSAGTGGTGACVSDPVYVAGVIALSAPAPAQPAPAPTPAAAAPPAT
jgi:hypothetical protein